MRIDEAIDKYIRYRSSLGEKMRTNRYILIAFADAVGHDKELDDVTYNDCSSYLNSKGIKSGNATSYWFCIYTALDGLYNWSIARGYAKSKPLPMWKPKKLEAFIPYIYTDDELKRIFDAALTYRKRFNIEYPEVIQTMLKVTCFLGLRPGETVNLQVDDVDVNNAVLIIRETKFYKTRMVPLSDSVADMLSQYMNWRRAIVQEKQITDIHLFIDKRGRHVKLAALQQAFRLICKQAGITRHDTMRSDVRLQDLRHTFATRRITQWYKEGEDVQSLLPVLSTYLGHCNLDSTAVYISLTDDLMSTAYKLFESYADL